MKDQGIAIDQNRCSNKFIWISGDDTISLVDNDCKTGLRFDDFWYLNDSEDPAWRPEAFEPISVTYSEILNTFYGLIRKKGGDYSFKVMEVEDKIGSGQLKNGLNQGFSKSEAVEVKIASLYPGCKPIK